MSKDFFMMLFNEDAIAMTLNIFSRCWPACDVTLQQQIKKIRWQVPRDRDSIGSEVLIGLTFEETVEFAVLDAVPPEAGSIK